MRKIRFAGVACFVLVTLAQALVYAQNQWPYCQILDGTEAPAWRVDVEYTGKGRVKTEGGSEVSVWNISGGGGLYYWRTETGDLDLTGAYDFWIWDGSGGIALPDRTVALRLRADYIVRNWDGSALLLGVKPGIYSDAEELTIKSIYVPVEVLGIQAFNPRVSGLIGVAIYPGFDRVFDPRFGVRMAATDSVRFDLMYPESRVTFRPDEWELFAGVRHDAVNEFRLEEDDVRKQFAFRETRAYWGSAWPIGDAFRMEAEVGWAFNREVDFKREAPGRDIEDAWYIRVGIGGAL